MDSKKRFQIKSFAAIEKKKENLRTEGEGTILKASIHPYTINLLGGKGRNGLTILSTKRPT